MCLLAYILTQVYGSHTAYFTYFSQLSSTFSYPYVWKLESNFRGVLSASLCSLVAIIVVFLYCQYLWKRESSLGGVLSASFCSLVASVLILHYTFACRYLWKRESSLGGVLSASFCSLVASVLILHYTFDCRYLWKPESNFRGVLSASLCSLVAMVLISPSLQLSSTSLPVYCNTFAQWGALCKVKGRGFVLKRVKALITVPSHVYIININLLYCIYELMFGFPVLVSFLLVPRTVSLGGVVARFELPQEARSTDPVRQAIFRQSGSVRAWFAPNTLEVARDSGLPEAYEPYGGPLPAPRPKRRRRRR